MELSSQCRNPVVVNFKPRNGLGAYWQRAGERARSGAAVSVPTFLSFQAHVTFLGLRLVTWGFGCLIAFDAYGNYTCKSLCTGREMRPARPFCFVMFILSNNQGGASYCY